MSQANVETVRYRGYDGVERYVSAVEEVVRIVGGYRDRAEAHAAASASSGV
jgi:hypothetical protein